MEAHTYTHPPIRTQARSHKTEPAHAGMASLNAQHSPHLYIAASLTAYEVISPRCPLCPPGVCKTPSSRAHPRSPTPANRSMYCLSGSCRFGRSGRAPQGPVWISHLQAVDTLLWYAYILFILSGTTYCSWPEIAWRRIDRKSRSYVFNDVIYRPILVRNGGRHAFLI